MRNDKENIIVSKTLELSVEVVQFCELLESQKKYVVAKQLLKSATSIGANVREAQNAESRADFVHKMKIALKEADETEYWLLICNLSESYPAPGGLDKKVKEIILILSKIVASIKRKHSIKFSN